MTAGEAGYWKRLEAAERRFSELAQRARGFAERLPEIRRLVEERDGLSLEAGEQRVRYEQLNSEVRAYYEAWGELVREARAACELLAGVLPAHEVEAFRAQLSQQAVGAGAQAMQAVLERLREFAQARRSGRATALGASAACVGLPAERQPGSGRWVTAAEYAAIYGISVQTLANWRSQDRKAGRDGPAPGKPIYRRFGRAVRYWLPEQ